MKGKIESIAFGGEGVLRHEGLVVFVPFTAPGDLAHVEPQITKKNFARGRLLEVESPGPARTEARCSHYRECGGCQLQHLTLPAQGEAKRAFIFDALRRIGKIEVPELTMTAPQVEWGYRRHIRLALKPQGTGFQAGYTGCDPSQFVPIRECPLFVPSGDPLLATLSPFLASLSSEGIDEATLRLIKTPGRQYILAFSFYPILPSNYGVAEEGLAASKQWQGIVMQSPQGQKSWGDVECSIETLGMQLFFSPFGFVQNHPQESENLYRAILENLPSVSHKVLDLYCGIGVTALLCAKQGKHVVGIETHPETVALAQKNAERNQITSVQFYAAKAELLGAQILATERPDTVLCNPPRTGLHPSLLAALCTAKPPCILYVSCMPSTLARDLKALVAAGYSIDKLQAFDMFPQTTHVETLVRLHYTGGS